jgi:hypothetical protein
MADVGSSGGASANKRLVWQASEDSQKEVIAFLSDPATHGGLPVDRVDTHISRIFLAGERAWKLKRARRTNFLDFSTLEQRERMCCRKLEVDRLVSGVYVGMTQVVRRDGRLRLGGLAEPVEWLVVMRVLIAAMSLTVCGIAETSPARSLSGSPTRLPRCTAPCSGRSASATPKM